MVLQGLLCELLVEETTWPEQEAGLAPRGGAGVDLSYPRVACEKGALCPPPGPAVSCSPSQILIPALMVTAEKDFVLTPEMSKHMESWVRVWSHLGAMGASGKRAPVSQRKVGSWGSRGIFS